MATRQLGQLGRPPRGRRTARSKRATSTLSQKSPHEKFSAAHIIEALTATRGLVSEAATRLGCQRQTIYNAIERHPEIDEVVNGERELMLDKAELKLGEAVENGQPWAILFYLKTQGRERGYSEKRERGVEDKLTLEQILKAAYDERAARDAAK